MTVADEGADESDEMLTHGEGESLVISERLIVSTATGLFDFVDPPGGPALHDLVEVGTVIGQVGGEPIRSAFAGRLMGTMAVPGERVTNGQPIAWLRTDPARAGEGS